MLRHHCLLSLYFFSSLRYISPEQSPNGHPLLLVSGSLSGTFTVYQINFPETSVKCSGKRIKKIYFSIFLKSLVVLYVFQAIKSDHMQYNIA